MWRRWRRSCALRWPEATRRLAAVAALLSCLPAWGATPSPASARAAATACRAEQPVHEAGFVRIGGIPQWLTIDGAQCANPVVLIVHGGPGNPMTPYAQAIYGSWQTEFTIVHWDQRGAGKTWGANRPADDVPLTIEQLAQDGIEVARHAIARLGKRKVILMGGSWGSALAVHMAQRAPELFHAYVGTAQLVDYQLNVAASYAEVLSLARAAGDTETAQRLEQLGAPPWKDPRAFGSLRRATRKYEAPAVDAAPAEWWHAAPGYDTREYEADYTAGEDYSFLHFVGLAGDGMGPQIRLRALGMRFAMPVFLLQGEQDLVTTSRIARDYFDELIAPEKDFLLLPRTGHDPNRTMIDTQLSVLRERVPF
jgi:pimeloyl-ACP methyl ester carboxylesterase